MWFYGGAVMMVVCGVLLVAVHPHLGQHMEDDSSVNEVFTCYARYVRTPRETGVLLVHNNHSDVNRYAARIRSPLTILNLNTLKSKTGKDIYMPQSIRKIIWWSYELAVVLVATEEDLHIFNKLIKHDIYKDPQSKYLAVCLEPRFGALARGICNMAGWYGLYNVAMMTANNTSVHSCFPRGGTVCHKPWPTKVLGHCQQLSLDQLYSHPEPIHYAGCRSSLYVRVPPPLVMDNTSRSEQPLVAGYEAALANIVTKQLHMTKGIHGSYYAWACYSSHSYYTDSVRWYVPVAGPRAQWKRVVQVFQASLWAAVLAFFLLNTLAWWLVGAGGAISYVQCVLGTLVTLLNGSVPLPRRTPLRFLVVSWSLCALVLGAAYQSQLLSTLLMPVAGDQPITNEQQLFASDMPVDLSSVGPEVRGMGSYKQVQTHERKFKVDANKPRAVLQYDMTAKYRARQQSDARGKSTLYAFKEPAMYLPLCVKLGSYSSFAPIVNRMMQRLTENGIVAKFMREVDFSGHVATGGRKDEPLTIRHLDFAFFVLLMGCALATLTFLLETMVWRTQHEWWRALCNAARRCGTRVQNWWRTCITSILRWRRRARFLRRRRAFRARLRAQMNQ